jgi:hypothetical protein
MCLYDRARSQTVLAMNETARPNGDRRVPKPTITNARATFKKVRLPQVADCEKPVHGRYVLVRILSEVNKNPWASAAEIGVIGSK